MESNNINSELTKPLIDNLHQENDNRSDEESNNNSFAYMMLLIQKTKKISESKRNIENDGLASIKKYIKEINDQLNSILREFDDSEYLGLLNDNNKDYIKKKNSKKMNSNKLISTTTLNIESFIIIVKEKLNSQLNVINENNRINQRLFEDDEDFVDEINEIRNNDHKKIKLVKSVLDELDSLENTYYYMCKVGPSIQKRKFSTDEDVAIQVDQDKIDKGVNLNSDINSKNYDLRAMNKWMGLISFFFIFGSLIIMFMYLWENL